MVTNQYPILSAREFIAQGTTAGAIMSIAESLASQLNGHVQRHELAARVREVAREVATITGQSLQIPAAVTNARTHKANKRRPANDNAARRRAA